MHEVSYKYNCKLNSGVLNNDDEQVTQHVGGKTSNNEISNLVLLKAAQISAVTNNGILYLMLRVIGNK